jgi:NAD(P)-dependent dehydrogenase (short-subunit alcohol dehydrogenase family)
MELLAHGLSVSIIEPGIVATPIWEASIATADKLAREFPPTARTLYGRVHTAMRKVALRAAKIGMPASVVAQAVAHALTAFRPRARYLLGAEARLQLLLRLLPDRVRDRLIMRYLFHQIAE